MKKDDSKTQASEGLRQPAYGPDVVIANLGIAYMPQFGTYAPPANVVIANLGIAYMPKDGTYAPPARVSPPAE